MALKLEDITHVLSAHKLPPAQLQAIVADLNKVEQENKEERAAVVAKTKNILVPIVLDPQGKLKDAGDFMGLVVQVPYDTPVTDIISRLHKAAYAQTAAAKRKRHSLETLVHLVEHGKRAFSKEQGIMVKGKELVPILFTDGIIPKK